MLFSPRVHLDKKAKILSLRLKRRGPAADMRAMGKVVVSYDAKEEVSGIYLLPFSVDDFCPPEEAKFKRPAVSDAPAGAA